MSPDGWLKPAPAQRLDGPGRFIGTGATVVDFWRWAFSDLRDNYMRGNFAEFLVTLALGQTDRRRKTWDNYDVTTASGVRVEVKASGHLQSWPQRTHSTLSFSNLAARTWDENTNTWGEAPEVRADVFVFCAQTCMSHEDYNTLDIGQWEFYVVDAAHIRREAKKTVSIAWVRRHAQPIPYARLADEIERVGAA